MLFLWVLYMCYLVITAEERDEETIVIEANNEDSFETNLTLIFEENKGKVSIHYQI